MNAARLVCTLAVLGMLGGALPACTGTSTSESTGEYIDDSVISNKVRAQIVGDKELSIFQIDVKTFKGMVQLSGFVDTADERSRAGRIATGVDGVRSVRNDLVVK